MAIYYLEKEYATKEEEAERRYCRFGELDPFPSMPASLLNSADIAAYVKQTAMICPFHEEKLKGASYDVAIKGKVIYWKFSDSGEVEKAEISVEKEGDCFDLEPNSIAFVTLEPVFRIPAYIALRFNLKITHIYKGLLLGTGPLVDPNFSGRLSIPLHNLTCNTYRFFYGDDLITMEFTKLSPNPSWDKESEYKKAHNEKYIKNNIIKNRTVDDYINKALKKDRLTSVVSSIPNALNESKKEVHEAKKATDSVKKANKVQSIVTILAVVTLVVSVITLAAELANNAFDKYDALCKDYNDMKSSYESEIYSLHSEIDALSDEVARLRSQDRDRRLTDMMEETGREDRK